MTEKTQKESLEKKLRKKVKQDWKDKLSHIVQESEGKYDKAYAALKKPIFIIDSFKINNKEYTTDELFQEFLVEEVSVGDSLVNHAIDRTVNICEALHEITLNNRLVPTVDIRKLWRDEQHDHTPNIKIQDAVEMFLEYKIKFNQGLIDIINERVWDECQSNPPVYRMLYRKFVEKRYGAYWDVKYADIRKYEAEIEQLKELKTAVRYGNSDLNFFHIYEHAVDYYIKKYICKTRIIEPKSRTKRLTEKFNLRRGEK